MTRPAIRAKKSRTSAFSALSKETCGACIGLFALLFCLLALLIYGGYFFLNQRSLIWAADGLSQHYPALAYYGEYLRTILRNLFVEHRLSVPMFDFSIGYGNDIVTTLQYYVVGDPFNLLAVFVPPAYTEYLYEALILLRLFFAGVNFIVLMWPKKSRRLPVLAGALAYIFCSFSLRSVVRHPFFITGMIWLPLILRGIELVLERRSSLLYVAALALCLFSNFYSAYMCCIAMVIYAAVLYLSEEKYRKAGARFFFSTVGRFFLLTVLPFLLSAVVFFPQVFTLLGIERLNTDNAVGLLYHLSFYFSALRTLIDAQTDAEWIYIGFGGVTMLCLLCAFVRAKRHRQIVSLFAVCVLFSLFPFFGSLSNGFSYVTNRWSWMFALVGSAALTVCLDELFELNKSELLRVTAAAGGMIVLYSLSSLVRSENVFFTLAVLCLTLAVLLLARLDVLSARRSKQTLFVAVVLSVLFSANAMYAPKEGNYVNEFALTGEGYETAAVETGAALIDQVSQGDETFFRYDDRTEGLPYNSAMWFGEHSTNFFFSIPNPVTGRFLQNMGLNTPMEHQYRGTDDRVMLQYYTGCRYAVGGQTKSPYYKQTDIQMEFGAYRAFTDSYRKQTWFHGSSSIAGNETTKIRLFETENSLPMFYTYDSVIPEKTYAAMDPAQRQNALLQAAVVEGDAAALPAAALRTDTLTEVDLAEQIADLDGLTVGDGTLTTDRAGASLFFDVPVVPDTEMYLLWDGFTFDPSSQYQVVEEAIEADENGETEKPLDRLTLHNYRFTKRYASKIYFVRVTVSASLAEQNGELVYRTPNDTSYSGFEAFMVNMGYLDSEMLMEVPDTQRIRIDLPYAGTYHFDRLMFCYQSLERAAEDSAARQTDTMTNVRVEENAVLGTVTLKEGRLLSTQIPYSDGWRVFVNGEEREVLNVNSFSCGVMLPEAGEYEIEFRYCTPHAALSLAASIAGLIGTLVLALIEHRKKKKAAAV